MLKCISQPCRHEDGITCQHLIKLSDLGKNVLGYCLNSIAKVWLGLGTNTAWLI